MSAIKKSSIILLCLALAIICLAGVFTIIDASSVRANQSEVSQPANTLNSSIVITPSELQATLYPDGQLTQILLITNLGDSPLTYTIDELPVAMGLSGSTIQPVSIPVIDPEAQSKIDTQGKSLVIIYLRELPDLSPAYNIPDRAARGTYVYNRLLETASHSQELYDWLVSEDTQPHRLLTANAIAATLNASQLAILAGNLQVRQITPNRQYTILPEVTTPGFTSIIPSASPGQPDTVEWNIAKIRADEAWSTFGITGTGAVVGIVDTGVMYNHPALVNSYRGNQGGGNFDHNYNWFDFVNGQLEPYDPVGHGTMGVGIISGDAGIGNQIGVAPGADWIAVRACNYGCTEADLLAALQWMLAPYDLNGQYPQPSKAPDVVLGMWGGSGCDNSFQPSLAILRAAGILPVFSPGAGGSSCATMGSPADLPETLAAGATDQSDNIASFSSRGPVLCSPGLIKPDLSAPGVNIRTSYIDPEYYITSGTSWSAAHAAGTAALVISANPNLGPDEVEATLENTAVCIQDLSCGGTSCPEGANYVYGHGRIDAFEAVSATLGMLDDIPWLSEVPISGTLAPGENSTIVVTFDSTGLDTRVYTGALAIQSNDPLAPYTILPVTMTVTALCQPPIDVTASFTPPDPMAGEVVTFSASATGTLPITFTWDFDDGSYATGELVTHAFTTQGTYTVTMTAHNSCDSFTLELVVSVEAVCNPPANLVVGFSQYPPWVGELVTLTASATGTLPISYTWGFDDGSTIIGQEVTHVFATEGMHVVDLTIQNHCDLIEVEVDVPVIRRYLLPLVNR
jgi:subtilisin family serine protease